VPEEEVFPPPFFKHNTHKLPTCSCLAAIKVDVRGFMVLKPNKKNLPRGREGRGTICEEPAGMRGPWPAPLFSSPPSRQRGPRRCSPRSDAGSSEPPKPPRSGSATSHPGTAPPRRGTMRVWLGSRPGFAKCHKAPKSGPQRSFSHRFALA